MSIALKVHYASGESVLIEPGMQDEPEPNFRVLEFLERGTVVAALSLGNSSTMSFDSGWWRLRGALDTDGDVDLDFGIRVAQVGFTLRPNYTQKDKTCPLRNKAEIIVDAQWAPDWQPWVGIGGNTGTRHRRRFRITQGSPHSKDLRHVFSFGVELRKVDSVDTPLGVLSLKPDEAWCESITLPASAGKVERFHRIAANVSSRNLADALNVLIARYRDPLALLTTVDESFVPLIVGTENEAVAAELIFRPGKNWQLAGLGFESDSDSKLKLALDRIADHTGRALDDPVSLIGRAETYPGALEALVRIEGASTQHRKSQAPVRYGALDFTFTPAPAKATTPLPTFSLVLAARLMLKPNDVALSGITAAFKGLQLANIRPGGADDRDGQVPGPLVLTSGGAGANGLLDVVESASLKQARRLRLVLRRNPEHPSSAPATAVTLIAPAPFTVVRYVLPSLDGLTGDQDEIAVFDSNDPEGARWRFAVTARGFVMRMPPQVLGEGMERSVADGTLPEGARAPFRFSPPAEFSLEASYFATQYGEAPWNFHRVMGYPGQRAPGARFRRGEFELVYGITTEIRSEEVPRRLQLAEIGSRLGAIPPPLKLPLNAVDALVDFANSYQLHRDLHASRIAALELYDTGEADRFSSDGGRLASGSLSLTDGVHCTLRSNADLQYPIPDARRQIKPGAHVPNNPRGLLGSYAQAFESQASYEGLWRDPRSNNVLVSGLYFTALGGFGEQRALFDNRRVAIVSSTGLGRVHRLVVERVGRIACLWHRARHVIVYERTVAPSAQFARHQNAHLGRALLRKVEEYVEVLEPRRQYPDTKASARTRAFFNAVDFGSPRMPVRSEWGTEYAHGYTLPLWREGEDPKVYPKPKVVARTKADGALADDVPSLHDHPEWLRFYANTEAHLDDRTDLWPALPGIDVSDEPVPEPEYGSALSAEDPDGMLPPVPNVVAGWEHYTFAIAAPAAPTNLLAERGNELLGARLTSFTIARGSPVTDLPADARAAAVLLRGRALVAGMLDTLASAGAAPIEVQRATAARELKRWRDLKPTLAGEFTGAYATLGQTVAVPFSPKTTASDVCARVKAETKKELFARAQGIRGNVTQWLSAVRSRLTNGAQLTREQFAELAQRSAAELHALASPVTHALKRAHAAIDNVERLAITGYWDAREAFDDAVYGLEFGGATLDYAVPAAARSQALIGLARTKLLRAVQGLESLIPRGMPDRADTVAQRIRGALAEAMKAISAAEPWEGLRDAIAKAGGVLVLPAFPDEVDALRTRLFGTLADEPPASPPPSLTTLAAAVDIARWAAKSTRDVATKIEQPIADIRSAIHGHAGHLDALLGTTADELLAAYDKIDASVAEKVAAWSETLAQASDDAIETLLCGGNGPLSWAGKLLVWGQEQIDAIEDALEAAVEKGVDAVLGVAQGALTGLGVDCDRARMLLDDLGRSPTFNNPSETLALLRAAGDGPLLPELRFNRERIAYFFSDYAEAVRTSPAAALLNRVGADLKALGIRVPTRELLNGLVPDSLREFDVDRIFADLGGMRLTGLFKGIKLPDLSRNGIDLKHGIDKENQTAWLKAKVDVPLGGRNRAFEFGPLALFLSRASFKASADANVGFDGRFVHRTEGALGGDYELAFGGATIVTFADTKLKLTHGGRLDVEIDPKKIRVSPSLNWLTTLLATLKTDYDLPPIEMIERDGQTVGARMTWELELPALSAGAVSVAGVMLRAGLELYSDDDGSFAIGARFSLSDQAKPFSLTIGLLAGGGWVASQARYVAQRGELQTRVDIGIAAGLGTAFQFGPVAGSGFIQFGAFLQFESDSRERTQLAVGVMLLIRGSALVCGMVWVGLSLLLQAVYRNGAMTGYGSLSITIRISRFFKISVRRNVTYPLKKDAAALRSRLQARLALAASPLASVALEDELAVLALAFTEARFGRLT